MSKQTKARRAKQPARRPADGEVRIHLVPREAPSPEMRAAAERFWTSVVGRLDPVTAEPSSH